MSNTTFVESLSTDPVERALARKAIRILNDPTLHRQQRVELVRQVQRELTLHRQVNRKACCCASKPPSGPPTGPNATPSPKGAGNCVAAFNPLAAPADPTPAGASAPATSPGTTHDPPSHPLP